MGLELYNKNSFGQSYTFVFERDKKNDENAKHIRCNFKKNIEINLNKKAKLTIGGDCNLFEYDPSRQGRLDFNTQKKIGGRNFYFLPPKVGFLGPKSTGHGFSHARTGMPGCGFSFIANTHFINHCE